MSLSVTQVQQNVNQLLTSVTDAKQRLVQKDPAAFLSQVHVLSVDAEKLTNLQRMVNASYLGQANAIIGATDEQLTAISEKLSQTAEIIDQVQANNEAALEYILLSSDVNEQFTQTDLSQIDLQTVRSLKARASLLAFSEDLFQGTKTAFENVQTTLDLLESSLTENEAPHVPVQQAPIDLRAQQDEIFQATEMSDRYRALTESLNSGDPVVDFEKVLTFYKTMKSHTPFLSENAQQTYQRTVEDAKDLLDLIIQAQTEIDSAAVQANITEQSGSEALLGLKAALAQANVATEQLAAIGLVNHAFSELSVEEKANLFNALSEQLIAENKITTPLPAQLKTQPFVRWGGGYETKLNALLRILPAQSQAATAATPVEKKADAMRSRFEEAKRIAAPLLLPPTTTTTTTTTPSNIVNTNLFEEDFNSFSDEEAPLISPTMDCLKDLQKILPFLQANSTVVDLEQALMNLTIMDSSGVQCQFKISGFASSLIADRPCFHLYFIHKNEKGNLPNDPMYGNNAMAGVHPTSNAERHRAIQRAIAEVALENLDDAINLGDGAAIIELLDILENQVQLDATDFPQGQQNIAYGLFGLLYVLHVEARQTNPSLVDPLHAQFRGDFGRAAFQSVSIAGIDPAIKLQAIQMIRLALKAAWKV